MVLPGKFTIPINPYTAFGQASCLHHITTTCLKCQSLQDLSLFSCFYCVNARSLPPQQVGKNMRFWWEARLGATTEISSDNR